MKRTFLLLMMFLLFANLSTSQSVNIEHQIWSTENLNVSSFRNGDLIPKVESNEAWEKASLEGTPAWCYYNNDTILGKKYGKLYNWFAVIDERNIAPNGWRVPSFEDFASLIITKKNNDGSFEIDPLNVLQIKFSGDRNSNGEFFNLNQSSHLWTSSINNDFNSKYILFGEYDGYSQLSEDNRGAGFSLRLISDITYPETETINNITYLKNNLDRRTFSNGDSIYFATSKSDWLAACKKRIPACCYYGFNSHLEKLGMIYNYYAFIDERNLAPKGFRLLTENDDLSVTSSMAQHGGALAGESVQFFGLNEFTIYWSKCTEGEIGFNNYCYWKVVPEDSPIIFNSFQENQGMYVKCIKK